MMHILRKKCQLFYFFAIIFEVLNKNEFFFIMPMQCVFPAQSTSNVFWSKHDRKYTTITAS